jgi:hypothetical protein
MKYRRTVFWGAGKYSTHWLPVKLLHLHLKTCPAGDGVNASAKASTAFLNVAGNVEHDRQGSIRDDV